MYFGFDSVKSRLNCVMKEKGFVLSGLGFRSCTAGLPVSSRRWSCRLATKIPRQTHGAELPDCRQSSGGSPAAPAGGARRQSGSCAGLPARQSHGNLTN